MFGIGTGKVLQVFQSRIDEPFFLFVYVSVITMDIDQSVTHWMNKLADGDEDAAKQLWDRYCGQLIRLAKKHLSQHPRRASDEEDVALSAFNVFCQGAMTGRFPELYDRDNLWRLLVVITARKASDHRKHEKPRTPPGWNPSHDIDLERIMGDQPTPEFAAQVAEECEHLMSMLGDDTLRTIAELKLAGYTNKEVVEKTGISLRSVERKLWRIRAEWSDDEEKST